MKLLTFLSLQVLFTAFLCSLALEEKRVATLDEIIKALGSLYQQQLFPLRDNTEEIEDIENKPDHGDSNAPELRETVSFPRQHVCLYSIPYCISFYASVIIQDKPLIEKSVEKNIRNEDEEVSFRSCFLGIELGSCPIYIGGGDDEEAVDVSKLKINDFCVPGAMTLNGTLDVLKEVSSDSTIYFEIDQWPRSPYRRNFDNETIARCLNGGIYCNHYKTCDLMKKDGCERRSFYDSMKYPCSCPVPTGTYDMDGFKKTITDIDEFVSGRLGGFVILMTKTGRSCFSFSFTRTIETL